MFLKVYCVGFDSLNLNVIVTSTVTMRYFFRKSTMVIKASKLLSIIPKMWQKKLQKNLQPKRSEAHGRSFKLSSSFLFPWKAMT